MNRIVSRSPARGGATSQQPSGLWVRWGLLAVLVVTMPGAAVAQEAAGGPGSHATPTVDFWSMLFVFLLSTFLGIGAIRRVSRLLHTPLMSLTNAISAIAVVGSIIVTGADYPTHIRFLGAIALFASMTNIVSGFLITDRMLKMFKQDDRKAGGSQP